MITDVHPLVAEMMPEWTKVTDVLAGPRRVKRLEMIRGSSPVCRDESPMPLQPGTSVGGAVDVASPYLPPNPSHSVFVGPNGRTVNEYANYLYRADLPEYAETLLTRLCGMVLRKAPSVDGIPEEWLTNITLDGTDFETFCWLALNKTCSTSFSLFQVDYSDELKRPYVRLVSERAVIDWRHGAMGGVPYLSHLRFYEPAMEPVDEFTTATVTQIRVYDMIGALPEDYIGQQLSDVALARTSDASRYPKGFCLVTLYREVGDGKEKKWAKYKQFVPQRAESPLGFIPSVTNTPLGPVWQLQNPMLLKVANKVLAIFRNSADLEELLHQCGAGTTLLGAGFSEAEQERCSKVGGGSLWMSANPEARAEYVQTNGQAGAEIRQAIKDKLDELSVLGGRLLLSQHKNVAESGSSQRMQFAGDDATLQVGAAGTAMSLQAAIRIMDWWGGTTLARPEDSVATVELNDDFIDERGPTSDLIAIEAALETGTIGEVDAFFQLQRGGYLAPTTTLETWRRYRQVASASREVDTDNPGDL